MTVNNRVFSMAKMEERLKESNKWSSLSDVVKNIMMNLDGQPVTAGATGALHNDGTFECIGKDGISVLVKAVDCISVSEYNGLKNK